MTHAERTTSLAIAHHFRAMKAPAMTLLPCPFCGTSATYYAAGWTHEFPHSVICDNPMCGVSVGDFFGKDNAVAAWNRRAPVPADVLLTRVGKERG